MADTPTLADQQLRVKWAEQVAFGYQHPTGDFPAAWVELAREIMRRARTNVERLVARLRAVGYRFAHPRAVHKPPRKDTAKQIERFRDLGFHVPLSLRVWWEEVGSVNLMGTHPDWPRAGYLFESGKDVWDADPLVVDPPALIDEYKSWRSNRDELGNDYLRFIGPLRIPIGPDALHKANFSGGGPYEMGCDAPAVDALVLNEPNCISFVAYLRLAFEWGGFPGLRGRQDAPREFIDDLTKNLVPL